LLAVHEMAIARAEPKLMPARVTSMRAPIVFLPS
jgi:hypothetical protein